MRHQPPSHPTAEGTLTAAAVPALAGPAATSEEAARVQAGALPAKVGAAADQAFVDTNDHFDLLTASPPLLDFMQSVLRAHSGGTAHQQRGTPVHPSEVTPLDLAGGSSTVQICQTLTVLGAHPDRSPGSDNDPGKRTGRIVEKRTDSVWQISERDAGGNDSCRPAASTAPVAGLGLLRIAAGM